MMSLAYLLYDLATSLAAPFAAAYLCIHPRHRPLLARLAPPVPGVSARPIWVQACSVGEVLTAKSIVAAMRRRWPDVPVVVTVSTAAGLELARASLKDVPVTWFPFDHRLSVRRFVRRLKPRVLVLIETELWPNVIRETRRAGVPVVLLNARLSDKHFPRYLRFRRILRPVVHQLSAVGAQNEEYAQRFVSLGADPAVVSVTGSTKFDGVPTSVDKETLAALREENGFPEDERVLVFGSTRPGDEALAATCWETLREEFPTLHLVIAPRHLDRLAEATAPFGDGLLRRSEVLAGQRPAGERVFVLDTVGELVRFYALATVAVVGGSFCAGVNGHNPLEPAALGVPTVFGPYMRNFIDPARILTECAGCVQVASPGALCAALRGLLSDPEARARIAAQGRRAVQSGQGAIERNLALLETVVSRLA